MDSQCLMGTEVQFASWKVLETDGADGHTSVNVLMPLSCTLKNVKVVNFVLCKFYHNKI